MRGTSTLIASLAERLGREPTEDEVIEFIMGDEVARNRIWNKEVK